jgi:anaerobic selenocysteine-containing dehydrogenase
MGRVKNRTTTAVCLPLTPATVTPSTRPFALTIGPILHHNGSFSTWSESNLLVAGEATATLNPEDAAAIDVQSGEMVKITSDAGSVTLQVRVSADQQKGSLFVPAHFREPALSAVLTSASFPQYVTLTKV